MMPHRGSWRRGMGGGGSDLGSASQLRDNKTVITISDDHNHGSETTSGKVDTCSTTKHLSSNAMTSLHQSTLKILDEQTWGIDR